MEGTTLVFQTSYGVLYVWSVKYTTIFFAPSNFNKSGIHKFVSIHKEKHHAVQARSVKALPPNSAIKKSNTFVKTFVVALQTNESYFIRKNTVAIDKCSGSIDSAGKTYAVIPKHAAACAPMGLSGMLPNNSQIGASIVSKYVSK